MEEVPDIITKTNVGRSWSLAPRRKREQFIEIFWRDRNPDHEITHQPCQEEHYRRLAYADELFASGIAGRKTDRGRIYIIWGPPDEIESHPTGGASIVLLSRAVALRPRIRGSCGVIGIWKASVKTSKSNFVDTTGSANTTSPRTPAKKTPWVTFPAQARV